MHRFPAIGVACMISVCLVSFLTGCARPQAKVASPSRMKIPPVVLEFGPVYSVKRLTDPLVARTVQQDAIDTYDQKPKLKISSAPATNAEIRGYLVDWVHGVTMVERAVMKDGSLFTVPGMRPAAASGPTDS